MYLTQKDNDWFCKRPKIAEVVSMKLDSNFKLEGL